MKLRPFTPIIIIGCTAAFVLDTTIDFGSAFGVLYIPLLFLRLTMTRPPSMHFLLAIVFVLTAAGFFLPHISDAFDETLFDRIMTTLAAVFTAVLIEQKIKARKLLNQRLIEDERVKIKAENIEKELLLAKALQGSILPKSFPKTPGVSGYGLMTPAREVGGDFFDFIPIDEYHIGIAIGDVTGKGIPAAFFMAIVRTLLRTIALLKLSPSECLSRLNDQIADENDQDMFVTIFYGIIDVRTGMLCYANGGHNNPAIVTADGKLTWLPETNGVLVGMIRCLNFKEQTVHLSQGDCLFLYTDGVVEAFNPDKLEFSEAKLAEILRSCSHLPAIDVAHSVLAAVKAFESGAPQADDITCVALRYEGTQSR